MLFTAGASGYIDADAVLEWFQLCAAAIDSHRAAFESWFASGQVGPPPSVLPTALLGATWDEVVEHFGEAVRELELSAVLWLVTSCEGRLRIDLRHRLRDKDFLGTRFRALRAARDKEFLVPLVDDGIFDAWKEFTRAQVPVPLQDRAVQAIGGVKPLIDLRHWLAHGRYWEPKIAVEAQTAAAVGRAISALFSHLSQVAAATKIRSLA